jgi:hypothetical protein
VNLTEVTHEGEPVQAHVPTAADPDPGWHDDSAHTSVLTCAAQVVRANGATQQARHRLTSLEEEEGVTKARERMVQGHVMAN